MKKSILLTIGALVIAGASFVGGAYYAGQGGISLVAQNAPNPVGTQATGNAPTSGAQPLSSWHSLVGSITSKSLTSITLTPSDGSQAVTVFVTSDIPVQQLTLKKLADVPMGSKVSVIGHTNSDGSFAAQSLILVPTQGTTTPASQTAH